MCRKDLSVKPTPKSESSLTTPLRQTTTIPYSPQRTPDEETGQQITYQEFMDIVAQSNSYQQNTVIEVRHTVPVQQQSQQQKPISTGQKLLKIALCLGIIIAIVVVVVIIL